MEGFERQFDPKSKLDEKIDYSNLPCPVPYEELRLEASMALKPELFEGFRFDFVKSMNQKFCISHGVSMGPTELPTELFTTPPTDIIKIPTSNYEFGAHFIDPKLLLVGRIMTDGRLSGRLKYDLTDNFSIKSNAQLTNEEGMSQGIIGFDYKGSDYRTQLQLGNGTLVVANYIQHVTPKLSLGGEAYWRGQQLKSGVDIGARYETDKMIASGQVSSNGVAFMNYVQKISERVSFAADFIYNYVSKEVSASVGYDYILRHCRLRGKIDSNGVASSHLEERLSNELGFVLSGEVDHMKKDYKFGFGVNLNL